MNIIKYFLLLLVFCFSCTEKPFIESDDLEILNYQKIIDKASVTLSWQTNYNADCTIMINNIVYKTTGLDHNLNVTGLISNTQYSVNILASSSVSDIVYRKPYLYEDTLTTNPASSIIIDSIVLNNSGIRNIQFNFSTDTPSNCFIQYGKDGSLDYLKNSITTDNYNHEIVLENLDITTQYNYKIIAEPILGGYTRTITTESNFITPDYNNIIIYDIQLQTLYGQNKVNAVWKTNVESNCIIKYGVTDFNKSVVGNSNDNLNFNTVVMDLLPSQLHNYKIIATPINNEFYIITESTIQTKYNYGFYAYLTSAIDYGYYVNKQLVSYVKNGSIIDMSCGVWAMGIGFEYIQVLPETNINGESYRPTVFSFNWGESNSFFNFVKYREFNDEYNKNISPEPLLTLNVGLAPDTLFVPKYDSLAFLFFLKQIDNLLWFSTSSGLFSYNINTQEQKFYYLDYDLVGYSDTILNQSFNSERNSFTYNKNNTNIINTYENVLPYIGSTTNDIVSTLIHSDYARLDYKKFSDTDYIFCKTFDLPDLTTEIGCENNLGVRQYFRDIFNSELNSIIPEDLRNLNGTPLNSLNAYQYSKIKIFKDGTDIYLFGSTYYYGWDDSQYYTYLIFWYKKNNETVVRLSNPELVYGKYILVYPKVLDMKFIIEDGIKKLVFFSTVSAENTEVITYYSYLWVDGIYQTKLIDNYFPGVPAFVFSYSNIIDNYQVK